MFTVQRKSTPDLVPLVRHLAAAASSPKGSSGGSSSSSIPATVNFDSLKSLPTTLPFPAAAEAAGAAAAAQPAPAARQVQQGTVEMVAGLLREELGLTLFGFDVVVSDAGEAGLR